MIQFIKRMVHIRPIYYLFTVVYNIFLRFKYIKHHLQIGSMSLLYSCEFGEFVTIYDNVECKYSKIENFTYITNGSKINRTSIGKFCSIGPDCKFGLGKHPTKDFVSTHPVFFSTDKQAQISFINENKYEEYEPIEIGNDVWIGANVIVLDGVSIGNGAIIAAGSVVTKDIPPYAIAGGVPAKIIKYRFSQEQIKGLEEIKWWDKDINTIRNFTDSMSNIDEFFEVNKI